MLGVDLGVMLVLDIEIDMVALRIMKQHNRVEIESSYE